MMSFLSSAQWIARSQGKKNHFYPKWFGTYGWLWLRTEEARSNFNPALRWPCMERCNWDVASVACMLSVNSLWNPNVGRAAWMAEDLEQFLCPAKALLAYLILSWMRERQYLHSHLFSIKMIASSTIQSMAVSHPELKSQWKHGVFIFLW